MSDMIFRGVRRTPVSKSVKRKAAVPLNFSFVKKIAVILLMCGVLAGAYYGVSNGVSDLKQLSFATGNQTGLDEYDNNVSFREGDIFTTLIMVQDSTSQDKAKIDNFIVVRLNQEENSATVISVAPDVYLYPTGYIGSLDLDLGTDITRIKDLMVVGQLNTPPIPLAFAYYQLENLFALPLDGYLVIDKVALADLSKMSTGSDPQARLAGVAGFENSSSVWNDFWIDSLRSLSVIKIWMNRSLVGSVESNMSPVEFYQFVLAFQRVPESKIVSLTVADDSLDEQVNERGEMVSLVSTSAIDDVLDQYCRDIRLEREQARIEIFNSSGVNGLGAGYKRLVSHMGGDVIRVENASTSTSDTVIYVVDREKYPITLDKLKSLFQGNVELVEGRPSFMTTGDIIVVLGLDFYQD